MRTAKTIGFLVCVGIGVALELAGCEVAATLVFSSASACLLA